MEIVGPAFLPPRLPLPDPPTAVSAPLIAIEPLLKLQPGFSLVNVTDVLYGPFATITRSMPPQRAMRDI